MTVTNCDSLHDDLLGGKAVVEQEGVDSPLSWLDPSFLLLSEVSGVVTVDPFTLGRIPRHPDVEDEFARFWDRVSRASPCIGYLSSRLSLNGEDVEGRVVHASPLIFLCATVEMCPTRYAETRKVGTSLR